MLHLDTNDQMRVLIVSLRTYSAPYNDGKLGCLGPKLGHLTVVTGDLSTLWGNDNRGRRGPGYEVIILPSRLASSNATARLIGLEEVAHAVNPTLIHVECEPWQQVAVQSVKLAKRLGTPIGIQFAECGPLLRGIGGAIRRARGSWVLQRCDYAVGWSAASTQVAERLAPGIRTDTFPATGVSSMDAVPPGSSEQWFGSDSASLPKLAFVGRFSEEKGIRDFLRVCDEVARRFPVRAALAGGSKRLVGRYHVGGEQDDATVGRWVDERTWAFLHGILPRDEVASLLAAADVLVCPSRTTNAAQEQFGKAAVEAMAAGTPVFAYDCGALSEVVGYGGIVVPEGAQAQLVEALTKYFSGHGTESAALADAARRQAMLFTDQVLSERLLKLWSTCRKVL